MHMVRQNSYILSVFARTVAALGILAVAACGPASPEETGAGEIGTVEQGICEAPSDWPAFDGTTSRPVSPVDAWGDLLAAGLAEIDRDGRFSTLVLASLRESGADVVPLRDFLAVAPAGARITYGQMLGAILEERYPAPLRRLGALGSGRVVDLILDDMVHEGVLYPMNLHVPAFDETDLSQQPYFSPGAEVGENLIYGYRHAAGGPLEAQEISERFALRAPVVVLDPGAAGPRRAPKLAGYSLSVFDLVRERGIVLRDDTPPAEKKAPGAGAAAIHSPQTSSALPCSWPAIDPYMLSFKIYQKWESLSDGKPEVYYSYSTYTPSGYAWGVQEDYIMQSVAVNQTQYPDEYVHTGGTFCDANPYLWLTIYEYDWYTGLKYIYNNIGGYDWYHQYKARYSNEVYYDNSWHSDPIDYFDFYPSGQRTLTGGQGTFNLMY